MASAVDWEAIYEKLPDGRTPEEWGQRQSMFNEFDPNNNGFLSLAEVEAGLSTILHLDEHFDCKPAIDLAFHASKDFIPAKPDGPGADYVQRREFRVLLSFLRHYFELWVMFDIIDSGDDRRIDMDEFKASLSKLADWGVLVIEEEAALVFDKIDANDGGQLLFGEFCKWAIRQKLDLGEEPDHMDEEAAPEDHHAVVAKIQEEFRRFDTSGDGLIDIDELSAVLHSINANFKKEELGQILAVADLNKDGKVNYDEFVTWVFAESVGREGQTSQVVRKQLRASAEEMECASLGVVRLDYDYPPAPGDIDHPGSYCYDVFYRTVPGLTFEMCQTGVVSEEVQRNFTHAIKHLEERGVDVLTGDCGFMMYIQALARQHTSKPVVMSSLAHLPAIINAYAWNEKIAIFTANGKSLAPMHELIREECGVDPDEERFVIVGCEDVDGFEAVALGEQVDVPKVMPGIVAKAQEVIAAHADTATPIRCILMECTELPPYSDALRAETGLPVFDAITACDFFLSGLRDNPRFGMNDWHEEWDAVQENYRFGENLTEEEKAELVNKDSDKAPVPAKKKKKDMQLNLKLRSEKAAATLGVVQLDNPDEVYVPEVGDIDCPQSFGYDVHYRRVPGLTLEVATSGVLPGEVKDQFIEAIQDLDAQGVSGITGDSSMMLHFQGLARQHTKKPVFMSAFTQLPAVLCAYTKTEMIMVVSLEADTVMPMRELIREECCVDANKSRFVFVGCDDVPGMEVAKTGAKEDVAEVTPGLVDKVRNVIAAQPLEHPIRAILLECTILPPYADALRYETKLPVYDSITCCDLFISGVLDNPRFGVNDWQVTWDGEQEKYVLGQNAS